MEKEGRDRRIEGWRESGWGGKGKEGERGRG
jgi:hypothetical protein